jgi:4-hydroxybenzoate polyprenyltransferase
MIASSSIYDCVDLTKGLNSNRIFSNMQTLFLRLTKRFRAYFGLSRMSHSILDVAHPCVGALVALGSFPPPVPLMIGLIAAFSGFTAIFGLNDVIDWRVDRERIRQHPRESSPFDIDALGCRHPIAQGKLRFRNALGWVLFWSLLSLCLAFALNPLCSLMMLIAASLEVCYCKLLRRSHWKALLSGTMVGIGALAGIYAYKDFPSPAYVFSFFIWTFTWEVGARNISGDWADVEEDVLLGIRTFPIVYGKRHSSWIAFALMILTVLSSLSFPYLGSIRHPLIYQAGALLVGGFFLIIPGWRWIRSQHAESAMVLFNRACVYPAAMFAVTTLSIILPLG